MGIIDKVVGALTPPETEQQRAEARQRAQQYASRAPWLAMILDHHRAIDRCFAEIKAATTAEDRTVALKQLGLWLSGHSLAEEAVIYPGLSDAGETGHATMAYTEQAAAKMQLGLLERLDPTSEDFADKLEHLEGAVKHHVYEEEGTWFVELAESSTQADHELLTRRYSEEFERYMQQPA